MPMAYSRQAMRDYMRGYRQKRMDDARQLLGGVCSHCGSADDLQFDHVDRTTKVKPLTKMLHASAARWEAELTKCQLLCGDCHRKKHGGPAHGLQGYKKRGCRCAVCRAAKAQNQREYERRRRIRA